MKVLVTGATGQLGIAVVARLRAAKHHVLGADSSTKTLDLGTESAVSTLSRILEPGVAVVHLAARLPGPNAQPAAHERGAFLAHNVYATMRLLEAVQRHAGDSPVVVYACDAAVYGTGSVEPLNEDSMMTPASDYAASKLSGEDHLFAFAFESGARAVSLRFGELFGPGRRSPGLHSKLLAACAAGAPLRLAASARDCRPLVHVADAARAIEQALTSNVSGRFNVSDDEPHELGSDLELVSRVTGVSNPATLEEPPRAPARLLLDSARARGELGFRAQVSLAEWLEAEWSARQGTE